MDEKIKKELDAYGLSLDDLTKEELEELKHEIEEKEHGVSFLDGVLSGISPYRVKKKK